MSFIENLMKFIIKSSLITGFLFTILTSISSQVNIKVGYNGAFLNTPNLNNIIAQYNQSLEETFDALDEFKSLHGLELGVRYKIGKAGFEASWHSGLGTSDVFGVVNGSNYSKKYWMSLTEYSVNAESYFGYLGIGAGLGYRTLRLKTDIAGARRKRQELDISSGFNGKLYLIFQLAGDKVSLAVKPYIQIPLSDLSFPVFAKQIGADPLTESKDRFRVFGISLVLYNGKQ
jgi:hypothetical protein